jgi:hypothetical protein
MFTGIKVGGPNERGNKELAGPPVRRVKCIFGWVETRFITSRRDKSRRHTTTNGKISEGEQGCDKSSSHATIFL